MNGGSHEHTEHAAHTTPARRWSPPTRTTVVLIGFLAVAGALLLEEHRAHALGALLYLLAAAAVFFCMFGHRHGGRSGGHRHRGERESP